MVNILFVDDDRNVLEGFQRSLRPMRNEWTMSFAGGGEEALELLSKIPIDVVVSDMKMPGMDGARLLQEIRNKYPQIIRIILSGYSEKETIIKSLGSAHQYLSKPCDPDILKETVQRAVSSKTLLADDELRRKVSQMRSVPSLPQFYSEMMKELEKEEPNIRRIGEIMKKDIGMTAKVLQIVNSAFFGLRQHISDVSQAISFLGLETIQALALGIGVFSQFEKDTQLQRTLSSLWEHSMAVAMTAKKLAEAENPKIASDAFTAGLLHDIGEVVLVANMPDKMFEIQNLIIKDKMSSSEAEFKLFETTHSEIGSYLVGLWGLPHEVVEAVAFHHLPSKFAGHEFSPLSAVHIANVLVRHRHKDLAQTRGRYFDIQHLTDLNLIDKIPLWQEEFGAEIGMEQEEL